MPDPVISVIVPTYNQDGALRVTLSAFTHQKDITGLWEMVVVDDGSTDGTEAMIRELKMPYPLMYLRIAHSGRAAARNAGLARASGRLVVFCDGDRAPGNYFLASHLQRNKEAGDRCTTVGGIWEFFFSEPSAWSDRICSDAAADFARFRCLAREPLYARVVFKMFRPDGGTDYAIPWVAFFSGNVSVPAAVINAAGGFDTKFEEWGFEHFELGYRLKEADIIFQHSPEARNYHFAHRRETNFYNKAIAVNLAYFEAKHPCEEVRSFREFLCGRLSLQEYNNRTLSPGVLPIEENPPFYYHQLRSATIA